MDTVGIQPELLPKVYTGVQADLEEIANRIIRESLVGVTKHSAKSDILTPWKESDRYRREVYVASGTPDAATRRGMFHRVANTANPELNSREGKCRPRREVNNIQTFANEHGHLPDGDE